MSRAGSPVRHVHSSSAGGRGVTRRGTQGGQVPGGSAADRGSEVREAGAVSTVLRIVGRARVLRACARRLAGEEALLLWQRAKEELLLANLRAAAALAGALVAAVLALVMGLVTVVLAVPAADRVWAALGLTLALAAAAVLLAVQGRRGLHTDLSAVLDPLKEDAAWAGRLVRRRRK